MYILVVTGLSGAGKSNALRTLEDLGYYCVDNLPVGLVPDFIRFCSRPGHSVNKAALVIDSRGSVFKTDAARLINTLNMAGLEYEILFLDCSNEALERRYNETRRRHPLSDNVKEGIMLERAMLQPIRERANYVIDTTNLKPYELHRFVERIREDEDVSPFKLVISSFGYKRGTPMEADIVLDMRFSKIPFYEPELRGMSGLDEAVQKYVMLDETVRFVFDDVENMLDRLIPKYIEQGKRRLMVAFGCTGGRHRSVCAAHEMYMRMKDKYSCSVVHRDLQLEAAEISERFGENKE